MDPEHPERLGCLIPWHLGILEFLANPERPERPGSLSPWHLGILANPEHPEHPERLGFLSPWHLESPGFLVDQRPSRRRPASLERQWRPEHPGCHWCLECRLPLEHQWRLGRLRCLEILVGLACLASPERLGCRSCLECQPIPERQWRLGRLEDQWVQRPSSQRR